MIDLIFILKVMDQIWNLGFNFFFAVYHLLSFLFAKYKEQLPISYGKKIIKQTFKLKILHMTVQASTSSQKLTTPGSQVIPWWDFHILLPVKGIKFLFTLFPWQQTALNLQLFLKKCLAVMKVHSSIYESPALRNPP